MENPDAEFCQVAVELEVAVRTCADPGAAAALTLTLTVVVARKEATDPPPLLMVTALGASALEAETLAKWALLSGPAGARRVLGTQGGLVVHDGGDVELVGPMRSRLCIKLRVAA